MIQRTNKFIRLDEAIYWIKQHIRDYIERDQFLRIYDFIDDFTEAMNK